MHADASGKAPEGVKTAAKAGRPIGWHLVVLALGATAPFAALTAYLAIELLRNETSKASAMVERHAQASAEDVHQEIARTHRILVELAQRPAIAALDARRCDPWLGELMRLDAQFADIYTLDASGRRVCSGAPQPTGLPAQVEPPRPLDAMNARKTFVLGKPARELATGKWAIRAEQPILKARNEVAGVVGITMDLVALASVINEAGLANGTVVGLLDPASTVITRQPDAEAWVGRNAAQSPIASIALQRRAGTERAKGLLGIERLWGFAPVPGTDWVVLAGIPVDKVLAPLPATKWIAALAVFGAAFVILLCISIARPISRPIAAIAASARRMSTSDSVERLAPSGPAEIAALADDLNRMLERRMAAERDLRESKARLRDSRQRLEGIVTSAMDAIVTVDSNQRITLFNPAAERMFGVPASDMIGQPLDALIPGTLRTRHSGHLALFGKTGETSRAMGSIGTVYGVRAGGEQFPLEAAISQVSVAGQTFHTAILRDITERMRAAQDVQQLNADLERRVLERTAELEAANHELEAFDYSISHDLRAPLNRIRGFGDALVKGFAGQLPEEGKDLVRRIQASGESMDRLVTDLLSLSMIARGELHRTDADLSAKARNILDTLQLTEPERRVEIVVAPGVRARADPGLMRIALENLLANAWKFTSRRNDARIEFGCDREGGESRYYVRDNGAGFDPALAGKLFQPFRRLHTQSEFPGTGVGLATVQRIIRRHGGRVFAEGSVGRGATLGFTVSP